VAGPLVLDAGVVLAACLSPAGFQPLEGFTLHCLDLTCWEAESVLHEQAWRLGRGWQATGWPGLTLADFQQGLVRLKAAAGDGRDEPATVRTAAFDARLADEAWMVAERCGFAKVYDAAAVALARLGGCRLVTLDARLARSPAARLATIVGPTEL
jgi:PIN domain